MDSQKKTTEEILTSQNSIALLIPVVYWEEMTKRTKNGHH